MQTVRVNSVVQFLAYHSTRLVKGYLQGHYFHRLQWRWIIKPLTNQTSSLVSVSPFLAYDLFFCFVHNIIFHQPNQRVIFTDPSRRCLWANCVCETCWIITLEHWIPCSTHLLHKQPQNKIIPLFKDLPPCHSTLGCLEIITSRRKRWVLILAIQYYVWSSLWF